MRMKLQLRSLAFRVLNFKLVSPSVVKLSVNTTETTDY